MENSVKKGDKFIVLPTWDSTLIGAVGVVSDVQKNKRSGEVTFSIDFDDRDIRGPFHLYEIGHIIRHFTPLEQELL